MKSVVQGIVVSLLLLVTAACSASSGPTAALVGKPAPYTKLIMLDGSSLTLDDFKGKDVVLLFWATWCPHSNRLVGKLSDVVPRYAGRDAEFVAVSIDKPQDIDKLKERITHQNLGYFKHSFSGNEVYDEAYMAFQVNAIPQLVIIDRDGNVAAVGDDVDMIEKYFEGRTSAQRMGYHR